MLYAVQLEDGRDLAAAIIHATSDEEAAVRAEQWKDTKEWEPSVTWKNMRIWRLGEQVSSEVKVLLNDRKDGSVE